MTVESANFINQLSASNPASGDPISEGDSHLRLIKTVLKSQFPNLGATAASATAGQLNKLGFEPGSVMFYASNTIPTTQTISGVPDWLLCDGASKSTSTFSVLFGIIGTTYGGSGSNFNVPDFTTWSPVGVGSSFQLGIGQVFSFASSGSLQQLKVKPINYIIKT
tara:strand:+ start:917 stop:1411 length:495 start_codon:yes stop_codon:yes gene_type:complete